MTIVGAGKMGLPLAVQFAGHGWDVTAVDVQAAVVDSINAGRNHVDRGAGPDRGRRLGPCRGPAAGDPRRRPPRPRTADVVVLIVPVMLDDEQQPDYRYMDAAVESIAPGVHAGSTIIFETTLPVGDTRNRFAPAPRGRQRPGRSSGTSSWPSRPSACTAAPPFATWPTYPKLVGGLGPELGRPGGGVLRLGPRCRGRA